MGGAIKRFRSFFRPSDDGTIVASSLKVTLTLLAGVTIAVLAGYMAHDNYQTRLRSQIDTIAYALPADQTVNAIADLKNGTKGTPQSDLNQKLIGINNTNLNINHVYLLGMNERSDVYVIVDGKTPGSNGALTPGALITDASFELKEVFYSSNTTVVGPVSDSKGERHSALSAIENPSNGKVIAVAGFDIPAEHYYRELAVAAFIPLFGAVVFSTIFWLGDKRRQHNRETLRFRSELVSIASHELRTPLTGIRWGQETLMKQPLEGKHKEIINTMYDSTLRLQESIEDILQLANWQAGRNQELRIAPLDIHAIFAGIFAVQKLPAAQRGIKLEFAHDWPDEVVIQCDMQRMKRVLNNLISNAIKYARPNTTVTVAYEKVDAQHLLTIHDEGIGIPAQEQDKVFSGFYRASNAIKQEAGGTGMGLYMSRNVIEQHGGKLWINSVENKGTTVYIQLP